MTYPNLGFYSTSINFANPLVVYQNNKRRHPTTTAAIMTSTTKYEKDYEYFARQVYNSDKCRKSLVYGTDGEVATEKGFESVYPIEGNSVQNIHLRCFDHVNTEMKRKLQV